MKTINFTGDAFIIPNQACTADQWCDPENKAKRALTLCEFNNMEYNRANDKLVWIWICSNEHDCSNLADNGAWMESEGKKFMVRPVELTLIPETFFKGKKEGETVHFQIQTQAYESKVDMFNWRNGEDIVLDLTLKLNQLDYRYKHIGTLRNVTFEQALDLVS